MGWTRDTQKVPTLFGGGWLHSTGLCPIQSCRSGFQIFNCTSSDFNILHVPLCSQYSKKQQMSMLFICPATRVLQVILSRTNFHRHVTMSLSTGQSLVNTKEAFEVHGRNCPKFCLDDIIVTFKKSVACFKHSLYFSPNKQRITKQTSVSQNATDIELHLQNARGYLSGVRANGSRHICGLKSPSFC